jgi:hypothetical protein
MKIITAEIEKIRAVREKISASFGHDPKRLVEYFANQTGQVERIPTPARKRKCRPKLVSAR